MNFAVKKIFGHSQSPVPEAQAWGTGSAQLQFCERHAALLCIARRHFAHFDIVPEPRNANFAAKKIFRAWPGQCAVGPGLAHGRRARSKAARARLPAL